MQTQSNNKVKHTRTIQRLFIETAGVEGQITTSCYYLCVAVLVALYSPQFMQNIVASTIVYLICFGSTLAFVVAAHPFASRFDSEMMTKWIGLCFCSLSVFGFVVSGVFFFFIVSACDLFHRCV